MATKPAITLPPQTGADNQGQKSLTIGFIGAGRAAGALAISLRRAGYRVIAVSSRTFASAAALAEQVDGCIARRSGQEVADVCEVVFITTPDSAIPAAAAGLKWHQGQAAVHCSGSDSVEALTAAAGQGAMTGVFHPLQSFAGGKMDEGTLMGITFSLEAEEPLITKLKTMACSLRGHWIVLRAEDKALYHASAVIACNYMVTLAGAAAGLWRAFGIDTREAVAALLPLMKGTIANIERIGLPDCLTGPIARGDAPTVRRHVEAIRMRAPGLEAAYRELGRLTMPLAHAAGRLDSATMDDLTMALAE